MMTRVDNLEGYFKLPEHNASDDDKRESEIVRLLVLGIASDL